MSGKGDKQSLKSSGTFSVLRRSQSLKKSDALSSSALSGRDSLANSTASFAEGNLSV